MRYPDPAAYLRYIAPHMKLHLFAAPADLVRVLRYYHPGVTEEHISEWRARYKVTAPKDDRNNMNMMAEERAAIIRHIDDFDANGISSRDYRPALETILKRPGFTRARAIMAGTWIPSATDEDRHAWTLQEDLQLLAGDDVRGSVPDHNRRMRLDSFLTPVIPAGESDSQDPLFDAPTAPQDAVSAPKDADPAPAPQPEAPDPAAVIGVGNGVKAVVRDDLQHVFIELCGHGGVTYTKEQVATAISRLVMVHDLMEDEQ